MHFLRLQRPICKKSNKYEIRQVGSYFHPGSTKQRDLNNVCFGIPQIGRFPFLKKFQKFRLGCICNTHFYPRRIGVHVLWKGSPVFPLETTQVKWWHIKLKPKKMSLPARRLLCTHHQSSVQVIVPPPHAYNKKLEGKKISFSFLVYGVFFLPTKEKMRINKRWGIWCWREIMDYWVWKRKSK